MHALSGRVRGRSSAALGAAALACLTVVDVQAADTGAVDTTEWVCEFCPFEDGYRADYALGATSVSEDSAYFGDATGYDEEGVYANLYGNGSFVTDSQRLRWSVADLGLDSRSVALEGGRSGSLDYALTYRELPRRVFDTTTTIFRPAGGDLALPSGWVRAPSTAGFAALGSSLAGRNIESDRRLFGIGGRYLPTARLSIDAEYRRRERDGVTMLGGSYFTNAALLPAPIDYVTDEVDLGLQYAGDRFSVALGWYLSDFENGQAAFGWQHPFTTAAGAEFAALAQPPDSRFQQLTLSGSYTFPLYGAHASFSAAVGEIEQDEAFLPYTSNANLTVGLLPRNSLAGSVDTTRSTFSVSAKPVAKSRFKLAYRFDERDNSTAQASWSRVIADSFPSGESETNVPYSYERKALSASGHYDLMTTLRIAAGVERRETDRDFQEVAEQTENAGWGRVRWRPLAALEIDLRAGTKKREIDRYNETLAAAFGQNPLMRKYNLAYRYREYGELSISYSPASWPVAISLDGMIADDSYTKSQLGITSGEEMRVAADLSFTMSEDASLYVGASLEDIESLQVGSDSFIVPDWRATHDDDFTTLSGGLRVRNIGDKIDLSFDYARTSGGSEVIVDSTFDGRSEFPELGTEMHRARLALVYRRSERLHVELEMRYLRFKAEDWVLEGVGPATIPTVLSLGAQPYSPEVMLAGLGFRYRLGN